MRWIEPQSRFVIDTILKRKFSTFSDSARNTVNWLMLAVDVLVLLWVLSLL